MIKDSGERTEYSTGAVRDQKEGKGRFDLVPLDVLADIESDYILAEIAKYQEDERVEHLMRVYECFADTFFDDRETAAIELSKHMEEGAKKYSENNWRKGIPEKSYIDSMCRHYMKHQRGDDDERHDRAFLWNVVCLIWTHEHITVKKSKERSDDMDPAYLFDMTITTEDDLR